MSRCVDGAQPRAIHADSINNFTLRDLHFSGETKITLETQPKRVWIDRLRLPAGLRSLCLCISMTSFRASVHRLVQCCGRDPPYCRCLLSLFDNIGDDAWRERYLCYSMDVRGLG